MPGGERLHAPTIFGMIVGFGGVALLLSGEVGAGVFGHAAWSGFLLIQAGMVAWSGGSLYQRRQRADAHPIVVGAVQQLFSGLAVLPLAVVSGNHHVAWSARGVAALFYLVTFGSIVGYSAYAYALDRLPVAVVSVYPYVNSVVAVALGWLFYREPFGAQVILQHPVVAGRQSGKAGLARMEVEA